MADWKDNLIVDDARIGELVRGAARGAVLGIKTEAQSDQAAHYVAAHVAGHGGEVVPVPVHYPEATEILGRKVYRKVAEIPGPVDIVDVFRNHDSSGWVKAGWLIFLLFFPLIAMLIYVIANGKGMAQRDVAQYQAVKQSQDDYIRSVAAPTDPSAQIKQAHELLEKGAITQEQYEKKKARLLKD